MPVLLRANSVTSSDRSSLAIAWVMAGWERCTSPAAAEMLPHRATMQNALI